MQQRAPVHPFTLSFTTSKLGHAYHQYMVVRSLTFVRMSLALAIALYVSFAWLDPLITPQITTELMILRIISCLFFLGGILLTYSDWGFRQFQFLMSGVVILAGIGLIGMILLSESYGGYYYYAGLILAIMYAHILLRIRFIYAALITWGLIITYITATVRLNVTPFEIYMSNAFFLGAANIMGMFASFWLEYYMKAGFWNEQVLNEKKEELNKEDLRKSKELEDARVMQINMLPNKFPCCIDYQFAFSMRAASEVGGDYYDYRMTDDQTLTFGIGDATGHGLQASVMVTAIKLLFSEHAVRTDIVEFLNRASQSISLMEFRKLYMAFAIGRLTEHTLELAGAGMPPALIYRSETGTVEQITLKGMPLGSQATYPYKKTTIQLQPEDVVLLLTDGMPELFNENGEMLGYSVLPKILSEIAHLHPEQIIEHLYEVSESWLDGKSQDDDMTFFVFKRVPLFDSQKFSTDSGAKNLSDMTTSVSREKSSNNFT